MAHAQHNDSDTLFNGLHMSRRVDKEMCTWRMRSIMTFIHFYDWRMRSNVGHLSSSGTRPTSWKTMYVVCAQNNNCQFLRMRSNVGHQSSSGTRSTSWKTMCVVCAQLNNCQFLRMRSNVGHLLSSGTRSTSWKTMHVVCAQQTDFYTFFSNLRMRSNVGHLSSSGTRSTSWKTMQKKLPSRSASFTPAQCNACTRNALTLPLILIELLQFG